MRRREFIAGLGSTAAWPLASHAQQGDRVRRIGVLIPNENDRAKRSLSAFTQALTGLGWTDGRNVGIDLRWGGGEINRIRALAQELVGLQPDIIVTGSTLVTVALQRGWRMTSNNRRRPLSLMRPTILLWPIGLPCDPFLKAVWMSPRMLA
jgi:putative ABC transport system substrate-binding protein